MILNSTLIKKILTDNLKNNAPNCGFKVQNNASKNNTIPVI